MALAPNQCAERVCAVLKIEEGRYQILDVSNDLPPHFQHVDACGLHTTFSSFYFFHIILVGQI